MKNRSNTSKNQIKSLSLELMVIVLVTGLLWLGNQVFSQNIKTGPTTSFSPESILLRWQSQALRWRTSLQTQILAKISQSEMSVSENWLFFNSSLNKNENSEAAQAFFAEQEARWTAVAEENQALRAALDLKNSETTATGLVMAPILSLTQRLIELPAGIKPEVGQVVLGKNSLLGWVNQVNQQRATVTLLKDTTNSRLIGRTQTGASGLVINKRGNLYLTEVPTQTVVAVGDVVITENQLLVPTGLVIGRVQSVSTDESGSIQSALLIPEEYFGQQPAVWLDTQE